MNFFNKKFALTMILAFVLMSSSIMNVSAAGTSAVTGSCTFTGSTGVAAIRDLDKSPLTWRESFAGTWTLEYDFLTYNQVRMINAAAVNYNYFQTLIESVGINAATAAICVYMGWGAIPSIVVGSAMSLGYVLLTTLNANNFDNCYDSMSSDQMMRVSYVTVNSYTIVRAYEAYDAEEFTEGTNGVNVYKISNPSGSQKLYFKWYGGEFAKLYALGV